MKLGLDRQRGVALRVAVGLGATAVVVLSAACGGIAERKGDDVVVTREVPGPNACGGRTVLASQPGASCGRGCQVLACDGTDGVRCVDAGPANACGTCGPTPLEECNGRDDDCDGEIDEGCIERIGEAPTAVLASDATHLAYVPFAAPARIDLFNPRTRETRAVEAPSGVAQLAIDGDWLVWTTSVYDQGVVAVRNLATGVTRSLGQGGAPSLSGGRAAFFARGGRGATLEVVDLQQGTRQQLDVGVRSTVDAPALGGDAAFYTEPSGTPGAQVTAVVARRLGDGARVVLSDGLSGSHAAPVFANDHVLWECRDPRTRASCGIFMADLGGGFDGLRSSVRKVADSGTAPQAQAGAGCAGLLGYPRVRRAWATSGGVRLRERAHSPGGERRRVCVDRAQPGVAFAALRAGSDGCLLAPAA